MPGVSGEGSFEVAVDVRGDAKLIQMLLNIIINVRKRQQARGKGLVWEEKGRGMRGDGSCRF